MSVCTQNPESQQEFVRDVQAVVNMNGEPGAAPSSEILGHTSCLIGDTPRSGDADSVEQRFDTAHGSKIKRLGNVRPKRRLSFGGLLGDMDSHSGVGPAASHEVFGGQFREALTPRGFTASVNAGHLSAKTCEALNSISDHEGGQNVDPCESAFWSGIEVPSSEAQETAEQPSIGIDAEDCLTLHATDLIRQIQRWSEALHRKETQLNARISRQEQRERRYRAQAGNEDNSAVASDLEV